MRLIGLTGGIGSGKSTVAAIFRALGVPVLEADAQGRRVLAEDPQVIQAVKALLGAEVYPNNVPDRKRIAEMVFSDEALLEGLNAIIHPAVKRSTEAWLRGLPVSTAYAIKEAAILFESGSAEACDAVIMVSAPKSIRLERVAQRDGSKISEVEARMAKQWTDEQRAAKADFILHNTGDEALLPQVLKLHEQILRLP